MAAQGTAAREVIARIMASERFRTSAHVSERVYADEPLLMTGRQMASYLPDQYRDMRALSRWHADAASGKGRWLSEAELFVRQGRLIADLTDDCPYRRAFSSYFPTYSAMSDQQLRGYVTWRTQVRAGHIEETSLSFAYVYLYELINGIGVRRPIDGFHRIESFWQAYRAFAPEIDRHVRTWLQDYVVYHGLSPQLLAPFAPWASDGALIALRQATAKAEKLAEDAGIARSRTGSALPLPGNAPCERMLFESLDALSTRPLTASRLYREQPDGLRHIVCAVYLRLVAYYRSQRTTGLLESWFGQEVTLPYTMFSSAVFFAAEPHADTVYELDPICRYRCERGLWTCTRIHGGVSKSPKLGNLMRAVDRTLRERIGYAHPLKEDGKTPKYLQRFIDREIEAWMAWQEAHAPRRIVIDLSQLAGIRAAAARTREALLIDEERDEAPAPAAEAPSETGRVPTAAQQERDGLPAVSRMETATDAPVRKTPPAPTPAAPPTPAPSAATIPVPAAPATAPVSDAPAGLSPAHVAYLRALLDGAAHDVRQQAVQAAASSEDLLVDAINEALFDHLGDTAIEYGPDGPMIIEEYRPDVEGTVSHA